MSYIILGIAAALAFILSTLSGGRAALMMVPIISFFLGTQATALIINFDKIALGSISSEIFRKLFIAMMVISGALMIGGTS